MKKKMDNQFTIPHNVLEDAKFIDLSLSAKVLYMYLCKIRNRMQTEQFYRSIKTLVKDTGLNKNTLSSAKKELLKCEFIGIDRDFFLSSGHRAADRFHLNGYRFKDSQ